MSVATDRPGSGKISRQIVLPWGKSLSMAVNSLRIRFFRSMVTTFSLARELFRLHGEAALPLLTSAGYAVDAAGHGLSAGAKELWLIALSLLVCTVGIVNAQLMSVTERFREIGIMKCLGALDRIILRLFLLEALIVGVVGSGAGALLGLSASLAASLLHYAALDFSGLSLAPLLAQAGKAWATGVVLSLLGVLYPAILAAKLQPIIVMREEH